ncbi:translational GTPase TypA [Gammaproteobacteria bacterium]|nr:translational GTPase TypA [Gammaproteobacteria bacterium]MDC3180334.1 translational GTPase TypA [bacterium]MDA7821550.1 translational GTPase TypA [Gammaproteobacteria bacterium]MDA8857283.1 translational GTPase TypA [Gammaproteobacteria bacterium]MDA8861821.1 translational GTPase TypA [Gammaproteobacteria bacterium]
MDINNLRNIAIIAHVDHGKTTLVDKLLGQSGTLDRKNIGSERIMDSNDQEKERGITITAKNTSIIWNDHLINIVDTPGHADFGGEVERALSMVDSVLLLVDAVDGPMPQTRFVTQKAFEKGLKPIVVINKVDRPDARPHWVLDQVFDLFDRLGGTDEQLDFPVIYASAIEGIAGLEPENMNDDMTPLLQMILDKVPAPEVNVDGPLQLQISALDSNSYVGVIGIGRIKRGVVKPNDQVIVVDRDGNTRKGKVLQVMGYEGLDRVEVTEAEAGSIVCITGIDKLNISDTICAPSNVEALPALSVDEPTVSMTFQVNDSPFAGKEGKFVTSRNIKERLDKELISNVALKVVQGESPDKFIVSGRGELHLSVLIETMRREGFELGISKPQVIQKEVDGEIHEPFEQIVIDVEEMHQGSVMEELGSRKAELQSMESDGKGRVKLEFIAPSRGIIGFRSHFLTITSGSGIMTSVFDHYGPVKAGELAKRNNGVMYSMTAGKTLAYALFNLQNRGKLFLGHGNEVYIGQIVGLHSRDNDLPVNPTKAKQLNNIRAAGTDENLILVTHIKHTLEQALEFIEDDELVEVTPESIRMRKKGRVRT